MAGLEAYRILSKNDIAALIMDQTMAIATPQKKYKFVNVSSPLYKNANYIALKINFKLFKNNFGDTRSPL